MTRVEIEGGSYGEVFPGGAFAVLVSTRHIQTHQGHVVLPDEDVLFLRCTDVGGFQLAGQGHGTGAAWFWNGGIWRKGGPTHGISPCIFDREGNLYVATVAQGSQGYRYVAEDNRLVTGDHTYADPARRIWEYTTFGDVTIGQGEACALAIGPSGRRVLEPGDCRFIRFNRQGEQLAVTIVKLTERKTVLLWLTVAELATLPLEDIPAPDPPPPPPPPPPPGDKMQYNTGPLNTYAQERWKELAHGTRHEQAAALHRILWEFRRDTSDPIEVFRKGCTDTTHTGSDGHCYAEDIAVVNEGSAGKWYKDVGVAFGASTARLDFGGTWQHPNGSDADQCFPPPKPSDVVEPPPVDPPPVDPTAPPFDLEAFKQEISKLTLSQINYAMLAQDIPGLMDRLKALENKIAPVLDKFDPSKYEVVIVVKPTTGFFGHTHTAIGSLRFKP